MLDPFPGAKRVERKKKKGKKKKKKERKRRGKEKNVGVICCLTAVAIKSLFLDAVSPRRRI